MFLPPSNKGKRGTASGLQLDKTTYYGETSPLVYLNLPCVLVQVAGFSGRIYPEVPEMAKSKVRFDYTVDVTNRLVPLLGTNCDISQFPNRAQHRSLPLLALCKENMRHSTYSFGKEITHFTIPVA